jgi:prefoldin subunit 5
MNSQEGVSEEEKKTAVQAYDNIEDTIEGLDQQEYDLTVLESEYNKAFNNLGKLGGKNGGGSGGSGSGNGKEYEQESDRIKKKIDEIDSAIKDLADNDIADMAKINELIEQKIAFQKKYKKALEDELQMLDSALP